MDLTTAMRIPEGATIEKIRWSAPHGYVNPGPEYATQEEALHTAIEHLIEAQVKHDEHYRSQGQRTVPLPESITIDLRWTVRLPNDGGSHDFVVSRTIYGTLAEATGTLSRIRKYRIPEVH